MSTSQDLALAAVSDPDTGLPPSGPEWLVANGLGGYAAGTIQGVATRRYHGLLVSAHAPPDGRWMMLNHVAESFTVPGGRTVWLNTDRQLNQGPADQHDRPDSDFRLELGLPIWRYRLGDLTVERRIMMIHDRNTSLIQYRVRSGGPLKLSLRPLVHMRRSHTPVGKLGGKTYQFENSADGYEISGEEPPEPLRLRFVGARPAFQSDPRTQQEALYREEKERGYHDTGELWSPGSFDLELKTGTGEDAAVTLIASTEPWERVAAIQPVDARRTEMQRREQLLAQADPVVREGPAAHLVFAADQFIITPLSSVPDAAKSVDNPDNPRAVMAGYYWFSEWGRDTMVSLEGLTLVTGRPRDARNILRHVAADIRDGLIPDSIPEGSRKGNYHTADASLWFFHAMHRYVERTGDRDTLRELLPHFQDIVRCYLDGTRFNIRVDPADGLVTQGVPDLPLTWMDAKVGDWVVTPRRGKPVEVNALWYNALCLLQDWLRIEGQASAATKLTEQIDRARRSFNERFWFAEGKYLYDVVDGDDGNSMAFRPNQVLAISLPHPILDQSHWRQVLQAVHQKLLTPVGLRSLVPGDPNYHQHYFGDRRSRDAAYHQGTVWPWLIGPFIDAWLKTYPNDVATARAFLGELVRARSMGGVGTIDEIFDAEEPYTPRGCIAQAWSVAEVLRSWVATAAVAPSSAGG